MVNNDWKRSDVRDRDSDNEVIGSRAQKGDGLFSEPAQVPSGQSEGVQKILSHHSVKFTYDAYYHWVPGKKKAEVDELDDLDFQNDTFDKVEQAN